MASQSPARTLWIRWKSLRLPWRRKRLVGQDLSGTLFWEHTHNPIHATRPRRTATYPAAVHPSDAVLTPAWLQWLRHTRAGAPSIAEQQGEVARQAGMRRLAAAADRRWADKASVLDRPRDTAQEEAEVLRVGGEGVGAGPGGGGAGRRSVVDGAVGGRVEEAAALERDNVVRGRVKGDETSDRTGDAEKEKERNNPWKRERGGPSEGWQPQAWTPGNAAQKR